jgi:uncharacterized coiled-coil protein SlyX
MDKGDRCRLFEVIDNLPNIEQWRKTLTLNQRLSLNHPNSVLRKFKRAIEPEDKTAEPKPTLRDSVINLSDENHAHELLITELKARITELEEEIDFYKRTIEARDEQLASMREHRDEAVHQLKLLKARITELEEEVTLAKICKFCNRPVDEHTCP